MGDLELVSVWRFYNAGDRSAALRSTLTLPTGKAKDPDDLADIGVFGQTAVENLFLYNYLPWTRLRLAGKAAYRYSVPDHVDARVPTSDGDLLPDQSSKENVARKLGDTITLGAAATWSLLSDFSVSGGYEYVTKGADSYSGSRGARYDLLATDSNSVAHNLRGGLSYDTIGLYKRKKSFPPMKFDFDVSNTVAGKNVDRTLVSEISVTLFF